MLDKEIREPVFDFLEEFYGKIRIFEEKITGLSRTDALGVIDGQLIGFEIKSDHDTYARLQRQTADYDELCDVNYLVIGRSHRKQADQHIPKHWGIICVYEENTCDNKKIVVEIDQIPGVNPNVKLARQLDLLWRPELALLQEWNGMPKYKWQSKAFVREKILERIPEETLKHQITGLLFERDYEELLAQIREVQKTTRPRRRNMSEQRRTIKAVRKKRSAVKKRAGS